MLKSSTKWLLAILICLALSLPSVASIIRNPVTISAGSGVTIGDIKWAYLVADHAGYYRCDGRNVSALPTPTARSAANNIGFGGTICDLRDRGLVGSGSLNTFGNFTGSGSTTIAVGNLPVYNLPITSNSAGTPSGSVSVSIGTDGAHSHNYDQWAGANKRNVNTGSQLGVLDTNGASSAIAGQTYNSTVSSAHTHSASASFSGSSLATHTHTVSSGGSGTPLALPRDPDFVVNGFIYLGA